MWKLMIENGKLKEENRRLKEECEENDYLVEDNARWMKECEKKTMEIKKLKETIKDHQFYEEKLEHRIIEFEELLHWE